MDRSYLCLTTLLLFALAIGACSPVTPLPVDTLTASPAPVVTLTLTQTTTPAPTATVTPTLAPTATLEPTPTNQGDCLNRAEFVSDLTIPDDTRVNPGEKFVKTWRLRNTGSCTWNARYTLVFLKGTLMSAPASAPFVETLPNDTLDVSVEMTAPTLEGIFSATYQIEGPSGRRFGMKDGNIWVRIMVVGGQPLLTIPAPAFTSSPRITSTPDSLPSVTPTPAAAQGDACRYLTNPDFDRQVVELINQARAANGLPAFILNSELSAAALAHSLDMGCNNFLSHTGSDGSTRTNRIAAEGYAASYSQEAIYGQPPQYGGTPQAAVEWWLNDALHRPIMLNPRAIEIGVGYVSVSASDLGGYFTVEVAAP